MLPFGRKQESEADVIGLQFMAKAGFDPRQAVPLWQNMTQQAGREEPAEFTSTHPSSERRIEDLIGQWQTTLPMYNAAHWKPAASQIASNLKAPCRRSPAAESKD